MKKILSILILMIVSLSSYGLKLSEIGFNKEVIEGKTRSKTYRILNDTEDIKSYTLTSDSENIKMFPRTIVLRENQEKEFTITATGKGKLGENFYHIEIQERNIKSFDGNNLALNKKIRIKQKYILKK